MRNQFRSKRMISAEGIIISNYIRYETLAEMTNNAFAGSDANIVNVYIDLYQLFRKMYRSDITIGDRSSVASGAVNMCTHYRAFYKKYYGVHARIYLVQTSGPMNNNSTFYSNYNRVNMEKMAMAEMMTKFMIQNCAILKELCKYLPDIYYIEAPIETSVMIYSNIQERILKGDISPNIIISTSQLQFTIPPFIKHPTTVVFSHQWSDNGINYRIIDSRNALLEYLFKNKVADSNIKKAFNIDPKLLGLLIAMTRYEHRSFQSIFNISEAIRKLNIITENIPSSYISPDSLDSLYDIFGDKTEEIKSRYKSIDLLYQSGLYTIGDYYLDKSWDVNLQDPDMIKLLNEKYFRNNPLDLDRI